MKLLAVVFLIISVAVAAVYAGSGAVRVIRSSLTVRAVRVEGVR